MTTRSAERRGQLLDAADRVVAREGPGASMNAIAAEAGITKPILYRHFGDKSGLYRALAERHLDYLLTVLRTTLREPGDRRTRTAAAIDAYLAAIEARPQVYWFLVHHASREEPQVRAHVAWFVQRMADELAHGIVADLDLGEDDRHAALTWGHAIVGMVQSVGEWWLDAQPVPRAVLVENLTDLLWGALAR